MVTDSATQPQDTETQWAYLEEAVQEQISKSRSLLAVVRSLKKVTQKELKLRRVKGGGVTKRQGPKGDNPAGFNIPVEVSQPFAEVIGLPLGVPVQRRDITKAISAFADTNGLKNPDNKREFLLHLPAAKKFASFFPGFTDSEAGHPEFGRLGFFNLQKAIKLAGLVKQVPSEAGAAASAAASAAAAAPAAAPPPATAPASAPAVKKVVKKVVRPKSAAPSAA